MVDGDTVAIDGVDERIRLYGIDVPESGQTCDNAAGERYPVRLTIGRTSLVVDRAQRSRDDPPVSIAINVEMIRAGHALHYVQYSDGRYQAEEDEARAAGRGMFVGEFVAPWSWRRGDRLATERVADGQPDGCPIEGNINRAGDRIFHVPGRQNYGRTQIDEAAGERWFCSEAEAVAAGWRAALR